MEGLVLLDKPTGITSFKAVATVRFLSGEKRIGHTGTLDPMATGVLPVLLGQATRLSNLLLTAEKRYTARLRLGVTTDTLDSTGQVTSTAPVLADADALRRTAEGFIGEIDQVPPMYSALMNMKSTSSAPRGRISAVWLTISAGRSAAARC